MVAAAGRSTDGKMQTTFRSILIWNAGVKILDRRYPITSEILACKPTTLAGLAVQTHAFRADVFRMGGDDVSDDHEDYHAQERGYVESVCSILGIVPAPVADRIAREAVQS